MASAPQQSLPLFYTGLEPLSSQVHGDLSVRPSETAPFLANQHAVPLTIDEFVLMQRYAPIVFSAGPDPVPLALMGLNEGVNVFFDGNGKLTETGFYVPAYVRRYPFMLARLRPDSDELTLCFDPNSDVVGTFDEGTKLFEGTEPTQATKDILSFNQQFEEAGMRTNAFMRELAELGLLMEGELSVQPDGVEQPFIYRGFQMVNEEKLRDLRGDQLRKISQSGMLPLLYAHLFSLNLMREIFSRQQALGKMPVPQLVA